LVELIARLEALVGARAGMLVDDAERSGLAAGWSREDVLERYRAYAREGARLAIVSHNGRAVIEQFVAEQGLPEPDAIIDRTELAGFKEESPRVAEYVRAVQPKSVIVVGDSAHDARLAQRLGAEFLAVEHAA
jgi:phosphoglycolate phosphatase-like HAD superfamily hydrolase